MSFGVMYCAVPIVVIGRRLHCADFGFVKVTPVLLSPQSRYGYELTVLIALPVRSPK